MFKGIFDKQHAVFLAKQLALINAMGEKFGSLVIQMKEVPGVRYGEPPFIIDDGVSALLLVANNGKWSRLSNDLVLSEEMIQQGYDAFYSVPVLGFGSIRLIPANPAFQFPEIDLASNASSEDDNSFFQPLDALFDAYV
jgi:hypothetical protein